MGAAGRFRALSTYCARPGTGTARPDRQLPRRRLPDKSGEAPSHCPYRTVRRRGELRRRTHSPGGNRLMATLRRPRLVHSEPDRFVFTQTGHLVHGVVRSSLGVERTACGRRIAEEVPDPGNRSRCAVCWPGAGAHL